MYPLPSIYMQIIFWSANFENFTRSHTTNDHVSAFCILELLKSEVLISSKVHHIYCLLCVCMCVCVRTCVLRYMCVCMSQHTCGLGRTTFKRGFSSTLCGLGLELSISMALLIFLHQQTENFLFTLSNSHETWHSLAKTVSRLGYASQVTLVAVG